MSYGIIPDFFKDLLSNRVILESDILRTSDGFFLVYKCLSSILAQKDILDFPDAKGERLLCERFFDDWFLYAVENKRGYTYSLLKLREQEQDAKDLLPADADTPGVTISFISFEFEVLANCLGDPCDENRRKINREINRVVVFKGQRHNRDIKAYFKI